MYSVYAHNTPDLTTISNLQLKNGFFQFLKLRILELKLEFQNFLNSRQNNTRKKIFVGDKRQEEYKCGRQLKKKKKKSPEMSIVLSASPNLWNLSFFLISVLIFCQWSLSGQLKKRFKKLRFLWVGFYEKIREKMGIGWFWGFIFLSIGLSVARWLVISHWYASWFSKVKW